MNTHWHASIENILFVGVSAILVINLGRIVAGRMAAQSGAVGDLGRSLGALVR